MNGHQDHGKHTSFIHLNCVHGPKILALTMKLVYINGMGILST